jgi:hypothetical protein
MPYELPQDPATAAAAQAVIKKLDDAAAKPASDHKKAAKEALEEIRFNPDLNDQQRADAIINVVEHCAIKGCEKAAKHPTTLLRDNEAYPLFVKEVVNAYAGEYREAVKQDAEIGMGVLAAQIPERGYTDDHTPNATLTPSNVPIPGSRPQADRSMTPEDQQAWDNFYEAGAYVMIDAQVNNLSKLHPTAIRALEVCEKVAREEFSELEPAELESVVSAMNTNNVILRISGPVVTTQLSPSSGLDPVQAEIQKRVLQRTGQVTQAFFNGVMDASKQSTVITNKIRENKEYTENATGRLNDLCSGNIPSTADLAYQTAIDQRDVMEVVKKTARLQEPVPEEKLPEPVPEKKLTIREKLAAKVAEAKETVKAKLGLLSDAEKLKRREAQIKKREKHGEKLEQMKNNVEANILDHIQPIKAGEIDKRTPQEKEAAIKQFLATPDDPRNVGMDSLGAESKDQELRRSHKMMEERIKENDKKIARLETDQKRLDLKVGAKKNQGQPVEAPAHGTHVK